MRPIERSEKFNANGTPLEYKHWRDAKEDLVSEIGDFCSFCGKHVNRSSLGVEHIYPKNYKNAAGVKIYEPLQYHWNNFLLACINCNSVKGKKDTAALNPFLPHLDNLMCFIEDDQGVIRIKQGVSGTYKTRTTEFINLVGLDRVPGHPNYSDKDDRWENRLTAFDKATRLYQKYSANPRTTDVETITDMATSTGFFSVWFTVFDAYDDVKDALINAFRGSKRIRFDSKNHLRPI